jgi:hypothetical protein
MTVDAQAFLAAWHATVARRDRQGIADALADDVTIAPPPYWKKLEGKDVVAHLLGIVVNTIEGFTYHREWINGRELALEFRGKIGEFELQGIDLITLDDRNRIQNLDVLIRPLRAATALKDKVGVEMARFLREQAT